ncbi:MAG: type II toxin-antitoxin system prevent-host-death family antitoxin [Patescibacteria group bacterium]
MEQNIISMREIQRNYKSVLEKAKTQKGPVFLGAHGKVQAVLMDIESFEKLEKKADIAKRKKEWEKVEAALNRIAKEGRQDISLSEYVRYDRQAH